MEEYKTLVTLQMKHDYFDNQVCSAITIRVRPESVILLRDRQLLFRQQAANRWSLIGNTHGGGVYDGQDQLRFDFVLKDPLFLYYTKWKKHDLEDHFQVNLSGLSEDTDVVQKLEKTPEKNLQAGTLFSGYLDLSNNMYSKAIKGEPDQIGLNFQAPEVVWEYLLIPRQEKKEEKNLVFEDAHGRLKFSKPEGTTVDFVDKPIWRCQSQGPIKIKEYYDYQLELSEILKTNPEIKRKIVKNVECPKPGRFHDVKDGFLRQIVYF